MTFIVSFRLNATYLKLFNKNEVVNMQEKELQLKDYIDLTFRYKWIILLSFLSVLTASIVYNFSRKPVYRSSCVFMIEMTDVGVGALEQFAMTRKIRPQGFYEAVIESRKFRNQVVQEMIKNDVVPITEDEALSLVINNLTLSTSKISDLYELEVKTYDPYVSYLLANIGTETFKNRSQQIDKEEAKSVVIFIEEQIK
ncbi:MAG: Wzz/FepE/Etk N-terminal domain-containing protein, partial [bacterium]|nr:Wzz/FepE/Etk N-terminal domain-containing protein [bacterium]